MEQCEFDADRLEKKLDLTIRGDVTEIAPAVEQIMVIVGETACAAGHEHEIELALYEALANAVRHGAKENPNAEVEVCLACDPESGLLVIVRDPGEGFDPASLPSPVTAENIMRSHGRGIFLINQLMDDVRFERDGTEIWMRKRRS